MNNQFFLFSFFLVLVKMVVLYVNQFLVLNNVHSRIGHLLVNVLLHVMVHNLVIKHYKDHIVLEMIQILILNHVVQLQQLIKKVVQHVHV
jgi:hypothetical protein